MARSDASPQPPAGDAPEDVLTSLEAMLEEVTAARAARRRGAAPADSGASDGGAPDGGASADGKSEDDGRVAALQARIEKARAGLANRDARIAELKSERDALRAEIAEMRASRSWRLTAPLRRLRG